MASTYGGDTYGSATYGGDVAPVITTTTNASEQVALPLWGTGYVAPGWRAPVFSPPNWQPPRWKRPW